jgi:subfamily B ATP-binding cassette protein MsbA
METVLTTPAFTLYKRLLKTYVWRYRGKLILGGICMVLMAATAAAQAYLTKPLLDDVFINRNAQALVWLPIAIVLVTLVNALSDYGESLSIKYVGQRVVTDMQADMFDHLMHADISLYHNQSSGRLISRLTNDIMLMRQSVSQVITGLIKESFTAIFLLFVMFWQSATMSIIAFGVLIFGVLPIVRLGKKMRRVASDTQSQLADFTAQLDDTFQGVRMVKAYGREDFESDRARVMTNKLFKLYYRASRVQSGAGPIMTVLAGVGIASIIWYSGGAVMNDEMTTGTFFSFIAAMLMVYRPIKIIAGLNTQLQIGRAHV